MPAEGLDWLPAEQLLTDDELVRLITHRGGPAGHHARSGSPAASRCCAAGSRDRRRRLGAATAARPEIRPDHQRHRAGPRAPRLWRPPGWTGSTLASTRSTRRASRELTRRDRLPDVLAGLPRPPAAGLTPVKINAVLLRGSTTTRPAAAGFCLEHGYQLRFIEQMPLDAAPRWNRDEMVTADEILGALSAALRPDARDPSRAAARRPRAGWSTAARRRSASSPRSPGRSAAPATAPGSPPTARCAPACSPARDRPAGAARGCRRRGARRRAGARHAGASCPGTASTTRLPAAGRPMSAIGG